MVISSPGGRPILLKEDEGDRGLIEGGYVIRTEWTAN